MPTLARFKDLECWQAGRNLNRAIYRLTRKPSASKDYSLISQIRRAAFSVTSNIAEECERDGNREFIQFLSIAKGSAGEILDYLCTAVDKAHLTPIEFDRIYQSTEEAGRLIRGL